MELLESEAANAGDRAHSLQVRALFHAMQGDFDDARSAASQGWALIEEYGLELLKGTHSLDVGVAEVIAGDLDAAAARLRRGHELLVEMGDTGVRSTVDAILADVEFRLGRPDEAVWLAEQSRLERFRRRSRRPAALARLAGPRPREQGRARRRGAARARGRGAR